MSTKKYLRVIFCFLLLYLSATYLKFKSGYRLWFRYDFFSTPFLLKHFNFSVTEFMPEGSSETFSITNKEMLIGLKGLIGKELHVYKTVICNVCIC